VSVIDNLTQLWKQSQR